MTRTQAIARLGLSPLVLLAVSGSAQMMQYHPPHVDPTASITQPADVPMAVRSTLPAQTLHILVGESTILHTAAPMLRVYVGNPDVLQTFTASPREVVVTAKKPGVTSLILWNEFGSSCMYTVSADMDPSELRDALDSAFPNNNIHVSGDQDLITLTGTVPTKEMSDAAEKLAADYGKQVANSLRVATVSGKQVQLKMQILEVDRTKLDEFGFNIFSNAGRNIGSGGTGQFPSISSTTSTATNGATITTPSVSNPLNFYIYNSKLNLGVTVQDLEQKDIAQILAEPTLTTVSGQQATFLSGGEFPFPVVEGGTGNSTAISIQFRPYGVKMNFTPTVNSDGTILLKIAPEVSTLDYTNAVTISGYTIPALDTRRAETEVELKDGQSFILTGLLDRRTTDVLAKTPGIANIPILGQLFHSKNNTHSVVDLMVIVTARIVDPGAPQGIEKPAWALPNMTEQEFDKDLHQERPKDVPAKQTYVPEDEQ